jgi:hypothetical protein
MKDKHMYSDVLSEQDQSLGFIRVLVANPEFEYAYHSRLTPAVIFPLGESDRIIKLNNPGGQPEYQHQTFGTYGSSGKPDWLPAQTPLASAKMAIQSAQFGRDEGDAINPSASSTLNHGVQSLQFYPRVGDLELPIDAALFGVSLVGPDGDFAL